MKTLATVIVGYGVMIGDLAIEFYELLGPVIGAAGLLYLVGHVVWAVHTGTLAW